MIVTLFLLYRKVLLSYISKRSEGMRPVWSRRCTCSNKLHSFFRNRHTVYILRKVAQRSKEWYNMNIEIDKKFGTREIR